MLGVVPLLAHAGIDRAAYGVAVSAAAAIPVVAIWLVSRHEGAMKAVGRFASRVGRKVGMTGAPNDLDLAQRIAIIHGRHRHVVAAALLHFTAWLLGAVQIWVAAALLGISLSFPDAFSLHAIGSAARSVFFVVPMGAGVQEVSFVLIGAMVGVGEADALALSLLLRARDLAIALPAMSLWGLAELREWRRTNAKSPAPVGAVE